MTNSSPPSLPIDILIAHQSAWSTLSDGLDDFVTGRMAVSVVHLLEAVDIQYRD